MPTSVDHQAIARDLENVAAAADSVDDLMSIIVGRLKEHLRHYDWVGFYMIEKGAAGRRSNSSALHVRLPPPQSDNRCTGGD